jgi:hypothetical protein
VPRSVEEYVRRWQEAVNTHKHNDIPYEAPITPESALFFQSACSTPMGEGIWAMPDFGDAICFFRYVQIPQDLEPPTSLADDAQEELAATLPGLAMMQESWERRRPKLSDEELQARKAQAEQALDALLAQFVREGYQPDMPDRLRDVVNAAMTDWEVEEIWVLPGDLSALLKYTGNPLVSYDDEEGEEGEDVDEEADQETLEENAPTFDLNNPDHRAALRERIDTLFL